MRIYYQRLSIAYFQPKHSLGHWSISQCSIDSLSIYRQVVVHEILHWNSYTEVGWNSV